MTNDNSIEKSNSVYIFQSKFITLHYLSTYFKICVFLIYFYDSIKINESLDWILEYILFLFYPLNANEKLFEKKEKKKRKI